MSLFYKESEKLQIKLQTLESLAAHIDPVLHILTNMIASGNEGLIQFIGGDEQILTNDVKKVVSMLDIRSGFFKEFISSSIAASKLQFYCTEYAYILCRLVRDFGDLNENYSILERLEMIKSGEQMIYQQMKKLRLPANLDAISMHQIVNYPELLSELYQGYFKPNQELFKKGQYQVNFVHAKTSIGSFSFSADSYLLEICKGRNVSYFGNFKTNDEINLEQIILCDYPIESKDIIRNSLSQNSQIPLKNQSNVRVLKSLLILTTSVLSEIELDNFIACRSLQDVLIVSNVSLKVLREISFVFGLQVKQSPTQLRELFNAQSSSINSIQIVNKNDNNKWKAQLLKGESSELNRTPSELDLLGERSCLQLSCSHVGTEQSILSVVISVPGSVKHLHNKIITNVRKEIDKLSSILRHEKVAVGGGEFESALGKNLKKANKSKNIFLDVFSQCLLDYSNIVKKGLERRQEHVMDAGNDEQQEQIKLTSNKTENDNKKSTFYDDYKTKKSLISSSIQILKRVQLTPLELSYQSKTKEDTLRE